MDDPIVLECTGLPAGVRVLAFDGVEQISTTYRYEIDLLVDPEADLSDAIGSKATLTVGRTAARPTVIHGILDSATVIENLDEADVCRVVLVPRIHEVLGLDRHSRVFVDEPVPAIVQTLLREAGLQHEDCEFRLSRNYDPVEFVCQYRESTLDFLMRWMERDGIYFYFDHDGARERLVILDDKREQDAPRVEAPYVKVLGVFGGDGLRRFRVQRRTVAGRVHVDDYDYLRPALLVRGEATVQGGGSGELRVRGAKVTTPKEAERIAKLRAEGLRARQTVFHGEGHLLGVHAGELFTLSGHPRASLDGNYLVTRLRVRGHQLGDLGEQLKEVLGREDEPNDVLRVELDALWSDVQFRPELRTQPPRVYSMENGVIEGDVDSDYAQLDEHGRYLVKFRFDERDGRGSQASARIRMMQPHAGSPEGMHFPLRKGTEVLLAFLGGDPDRPVIAGAVPNAVNPAVVNADNATRNVIHTGGGNKIQIEDAEGKQHIHIRTPHKGSYIHLGAPFNPAYSHVTNTAGTSLSFTEDISTSVTYTDAQTVVEDARITLIGRARMQATDTAGTEIANLVAADFINRFDEGDVIYHTIASDAAKVFVAGTSSAPDTPSPPPTDGTLDSGSSGLAFVAIGQAFVDVDAIADPTSATPANQATMQRDITALQVAVNQALTDLATLSSDASAFATASGGSSTSPTANATDSTSSIASTWKTNVKAAVTAMTSLQDAVENLNDLLAAAIAAAPPLNLSAVKSAIHALSTASTSVRGAVNTAVTTIPTLPASAPDCPNPSVTASYIKLPHLDASGNNQIGPSDGQPIDASTANPVTLSVQDTTALDMMDMSAYPPDKYLLPGYRLPNPMPAPVPFRRLDTPWPLSPGSDVKLVGGDNVTLAARDARSHTQGHAYGLVQGGTTSVVYSPDKYGAAVSVADGNASVGGAPVRPTPVTPQAWSANSLAQVSTVYGNVRSWTDGSTDGTVTGSVTQTIGMNKTSTIGGSVTTTIVHDQTTTIGQPPINPVLITLIPLMALTGVSAAGSTVTTNIFGKRFTTVLGSDLSFTAGLKTNLVAGINTSLVVGLTLNGYVGAKIDWSVGPHVKLKNFHVDQKATDMNTAMLHLLQTVTHLADHSVNVSTSEMHALANDLTVYAG